MNRFVLGLATFALLLVFSGCTESALVGSDEEATVSSDQKTVLVDVFAAKHDKGKGKSKDKKPDSPPGNPDPPGKPDDPGNPGKPEKVEVCHVNKQGVSKTISVSEKSLKKHLDHGDKEGACLPNGG